MVNIMSDKKHPYWVIRSRGIHVDDYWCSFPGGEEEWGDDKSYRFKFDTARAAREHIQHEMPVDLGTGARVVKVTRKQEVADLPDPPGPHLINTTWVIRNHECTDQRWSDIHGGWVDKESDSYTNFYNLDDVYRANGHVASKHLEMGQVVRVDFMSDKSEIEVEEDEISTEPGPTPGTVYVFRDNRRRAFTVVDPPSDYLEEDAVFWIDVNNFDEPMLFGTVVDWHRCVATHELDVIHSPDNL